MYCFSGSIQESREEGDTCCEESRPARQGCQGAQFSCVIMNSLVNLRVGRLERRVQEETSWGVGHDLVVHDQ